MMERQQRWSTVTKSIVALVALAIVVYLLFTFREVIPPLGMALLLAFILSPIVNFLESRAGMSRGLAASLVFLVLVVLILGSLAAPVAIVPSISRALTSVQSQVEGVIQAIDQLLQEPLEIGGYVFDLSEVYGTLSEGLTSFVGDVVEGTLGIVSNIASLFLWLIFTLIAAYYLVKDARRFSRQLERLAPPGYVDDFKQLRSRISEVWSAFLRAQLLLGVIVAVITTTLAVVLGLPYALALGILAGLMEFVPSVGPVIAAVPAVLLALLQGSQAAYLELLDPLWFAVLVAVTYIVIQQVENNVLVPRIMGGSLNLHPVLVLIALVVGGLTGGVLGLLLASPILATGRVVASYVFCRLTDRDPFAEEPEEEEKAKKPSTPRVLKRLWRRAVSWVKEKLGTREGDSRDEEPQK
jgi:predicted PurR-regulated permease PerM